MAARTIGKLSAVAVTKAKARGYLSDGGGLYLQISDAGTKSWVFRFKVDGRLREMGIGPLHTITLAEARAAATEARKLRLQNIDPIDARASEKARAKIEASKGMTFKQCAQAYIEAHKSGWKNEKHAAQWPASLEAYAYPTIGALPVQSVDVGLVMKILEPIWTTKTETASRLRGRIEAVLDWATVRTFRHGENPARWRGHLESLLPRRSKVQKVEHHAALPYDQVAEFLTALRSQAGISAEALQFAILTAARTGEVIGAAWAEIDFSAKVWTVPASRMKGNREHRVPLSGAALEILDRQKINREKIGPLEGYVFPGGKAGKSLSNMALLMTLQRMERGDLTAHGFRSTFRDWAAERTNFPREAAEMALAHAVGDKVEAAYRRGDLFQKRRQLMEAWAKHCKNTGSGGQVVKLQSVATP